MHTHTINCHAKLAHTSKAHTISSHTKPCCLPTHLQDVAHGGVIRVHLSGLQLLQELHHSLGVAAEPVTAHGHAHQGDALQCLGTQQAVGLVGGANEDGVQQGHDAVVVLDEQALFWGEEEEEVVGREARVGVEFWKGCVEVY